MLNLSNEASDLTPFSKLLYLRYLSTYRSYLRSLSLGRLPAIGYHLITIAFRGSSKATLHPFDLSATNIVGYITYIESVRSSPSVVS